MINVMPMEQIAVLVKETVDAGGEFILHPRGTSMYPYLRENETAAVLVAIDAVRKYDTVLYRRNDGTYVLHRVVKVKNDSFTMCGDNQFRLERGIRREQIIAKLSAVIEGKKRLDANDKANRRYLRRLPLRRFYKRIRAIARRIIKGK